MEQGRLSLILAREISHIKNLPVLLEEQCWKKRAGAFQKGQQRYPVQEVPLVLSNYTPPGHLRGNPRPPSAPPQTYPRAVVPVPQLEPIPQGAHPPLLQERKKIFPQEVIAVVLVGLILQEFLLAGQK